MPRSLSKQQRKMQNSATDLRQNYMNFNSALSREGVLNNRLTGHNFEEREGAMSVKVSKPIQGKYIDKNIHQTISRLEAYQKHREKINTIHDSDKKPEKIEGNIQYLNLKSQIKNIKAHAKDHKKAEQNFETKRSN